VPTEDTTEILHRFDPNNSPWELVNGREEGRELPLAGGGGSGPGSEHRSGEHLGDQWRKEEGSGWRERGENEGGTPQKNRDLQPNPVLRPMDVFFLAFFHQIQRGFGIGIVTIRRELEDQRPAEWQQFNCLQVNMSAAQKTENVITLKGSVAVVSEFFYCAINSILYQRGEFVVRPNCSTDFWPTREGVELLI
jgi:hypothetical protein